MIEQLYAEMSQSLTKWENLTRERKYVLEQFVARNPTSSYAEREQFREATANKDELDALYSKYNRLYENLKTKLKAGAIVESGNVYVLIKDDEIPYEDIHCLPVTTAPMMETVEKKRRFSVGVDAIPQKITVRQFVEREGLIPGSILCIRGQDVLVGHISSEEDNWLFINGDELLTQVCIVDIGLTFKREPKHGQT